MSGRDACGRAVDQVWAGGWLGSVAGLGTLSGWCLDFPSDAGREEQHTQHSTVTAQRQQRNQHINVGSGI